MIKKNYTCIHCGIKIKWGKRCKECRKEVIDDWDARAQKDHYAGIGDYDYHLRFPSNPNDRETY